MADDNKASFFSSVSPQQMLAIMTLLSSTLLLQFQPLNSRRDVEKATVSSAYDDDHKFSASHVEDPLGALQAMTIVDPSEEQTFNRKTMVQAHSHWGFFTDLRDGVKRLNSGERAHILCSLLRPGTDLQAREQRQKQRLAVVSALASAGFVPESSRLMECCRLKRLGPMKVNEEQLRTDDWQLGDEMLDIPFEWFVRTDSILGIKDSKQTTSVKEPRDKVVCVLWLDSNFLKIKGQQSKPLKNLRLMLNAMLTGHPRNMVDANTEAIPPEKLRVSIMGPNDSGGQMAMLKEESKRKEEVSTTPAGPWPGEMHMVSPYATASAEALLRGASIVQESKATEPNQKWQQQELQVQDLMNRALRARTPAAGTSAEPELFIRVPVTDDYVALAMVAELKRRGIHFPEQKNGSDDPKYGDVVLVSEFDTGYGRELTAGVLAATPGYRGDETWNHPESRWHWTNFPRGLDGRFSSAADPGSEKKSDGKGDRMPGEEPRGINQMDALRRLAQQLAELDAARKRENKPGVVAVGVLGGEPFDKLLVFRALRPQLQDAQFFTNGMDAWLWDRDELRATKNLLVASPFGLRLGDRLQAGKPPFRDSYQTGVYVGMLALVLDGEPLSTLKKQLTLADADVAKQTQQRTDSVRLFEIGRERPVDMSLPSQDKLPDYLLHPDAKHQTAFWAEPKRWWAGFGIVALAIAGIAASLVVSHMPELVAKDKGGSGILAMLRGWRATGRLVLPKWAKKSLHAIVVNPVWAALLILAAPLVAYGCFLKQGSGGESFTFMHGVGAWPYFMLQVFAGLMCVKLIAETLAMLWKGEDRLRHDYFATLNANLPQRQGLERFKHWVSCMFLNWEKADIVQKAAGPAKPSMEAEEAPALKIEKLWQAFRNSGKMTYRLLRSGFVALLMLLAMDWLSQIYPSPNIPVRGEDTRELFMNVETLASLLFIWLSVLVFDALWLNRIFIDWFARGTSEWSDAQLSQHKPEASMRKHVCDYVDLKLIADWTRDIGKLTALPFYVLSLLLLSRLNFFDAWRWPLHLGVMYALMVVLVITAAYRIHAGAQRLRKNALQAMNTQYSPLVDNPFKKKIVDEIQQLSHGAFMPFMKQPVMEALYWMISALSVTGLWQAISQFTG